VQYDNRNQQPAATARTPTLLWAALAIGFGAAASQAAAEPFAYVTSGGSRNVSVIDMAANAVAATIPTGINPQGVAVTPDGKRVYVANQGSSSVSVIDATTNEIAATIPVGSNPVGVAIAPDAKRVYVTNIDSATVSVIDADANAVVATIAAGSPTGGVAVNPDGKHVYVATTNNVSVIDAATNTVAATIAAGNFFIGMSVAPDGKHAYATKYNPDAVLVIDTAANAAAAVIPVGSLPIGIAVTPDGKRAYVTNTAFPSSVSVIDTAANSVVATIQLETSARAGVAIAPDGKHVYVASGQVPGGVAVIDTATNAVTATIAVGNFPSGIGILPPPAGAPFLAFNAKLQIAIDRKAKKDAFALESSFTLSSSASNGIHPAAESVTLKVGGFSVALPPGSFKKHEDGLFVFHGVVDGAKIEALIKRTGTLRYAFLVTARSVDLTGVKNPVPVTLAIGDDSGATSVNAIRFEGIGLASE